MTNRPHLTDEYAPPEMLPDPPPALDAMQQEPFASEIRSVLRHHFARYPDVLVAGEGYLCYETRNRANWLVPDCLVAFGVAPQTVLDRNGYVISTVGHPPDLVLEVASASTGMADYTSKREGYAAYGVAEYWRFDATGGRYHDQALAGDLLVNNEIYQPIELHHEPDGLIWGHSPVLGLDLCWDNGRLRFYDPAAKQYLHTVAEAEARAEAEQSARQAAEARAEAAEAELRQLREQLRRQSE